MFKIWNKLLCTGHKLLVIEHDFAHHMHMREIQAMGKVSRLFHKKTRRHLAGIILGMGIMLIGSAMALNAATVLAYLHVPHFMWDALSYGTHAVGTIPLLRHFEPLWRIFVE